MNMGKLSPRALQQRLLLVLVACAIIVGSAWLGYTVSERRGIATARAEANHRLNLAASAADGVIRRLEHVPATIQLSRDVLDLLREPQRRQRIAATNDHLRRLNAHVGSLAAYVLNDRGVVLASSNGEPGDDSSVGEDVSFRPYFLEALSGRVGRHFAIGIKRGQPGYFVSHPIHDGARVVGVAAIKVSIEPINQTWDLLGGPALLTDGNDIVILSAHAAWRYTALTPVPLERRVDLQLTRTYNNLRIQPFPLTLQRVDDGSGKAGDVASLRLPAEAAASDTMVLSRPLDGMDWRLVLFHNLRAVRSEAAMNALAAAVAAGFVVLLTLHLSQRRRSMRQKLEARQALERANLELEEKVDARTRDLTEANERLLAEVGEREQAENSLRAAHDELVHAAKMAVLGQMATGITHELTQPLGAIRTLSGNAIEFLKREDWPALSGNLRIINRLADQMGGIIQPLRGFARKSAPRASATDVAHAMTNALFLYELPLRKHGVQVLNRCSPGSVQAWCDPNRLEQVLINLIGNAIDAMVGAPQRVLTLEARADANGAVRIDVLDTGCGFDAATRAQLFEPFFTTKAGGTGLGLGLAISRDIVRGFEGDIEADSRPEGGARLTLRLPATLASSAAA